MIAQSYGAVADLFGKPVFEWVQRREDDKISAWLDRRVRAFPKKANKEEPIDYSEYQEPLKVMRARLRAERKAARRVST